MIMSRQKPMPASLSNRAAVFIIQNQSILLLHRKKNDEVFDAVPGGTVEEGETPALTAIREIKEETGLGVTVTGPVLTLRNQGRTEFYFDAVEITGIPELGGPEAERNSPQNHYALVTVPLDRLDQRGIRPQELRDWMLARDWSANGA